MLSPPSNWVVQKFGGTSVGKFPVQIVDDIIKFYSDPSNKTYNNNVAVVCSARSSYTKAEGTTSRLLRCCDLASQEMEFNDIIEVIKADHIDNAERYVQDPVLQTKLIADTTKESVSYTHLDVYKRQLLALPCALIGRFILSFYYK